MCGMHHFHGLVSNMPVHAALLAHGGRCRALHAPKGTPREKGIIPPGLSDSLQNVARGEPWDIPAVVAITFERRLDARFNLSAVQ